MSSNMPKIWQKMKKSLVQLALNPFLHGTSKTHILRTPNPSLTMHTIFLIFIQVIVRRDWLPFQFIHYDKHPYKMYLENNGHTAKVTFDPASCEDIPKLIQGNLPGKYFQ